MIHTLSHFDLGDLTVGEFLHLLDRGRTRRHLVGDTR